MRSLPLRIVCGPAAKTAATSTADATTCRRSLFHLIPVPDGKGAEFADALGGTVSARSGMHDQYGVQTRAVFPIRQQATIFPEIRRDLRLPSRALGPIDRREPGTLEGLVDCNRQRSFRAMISRRDFALEGAGLGVFLAVGFWEPCANCGKS